MQSMVALAVLNLSSKSPLVVHKPRDNIRPFLPSNSISACIGLQKVIKGLPSAGTKCNNSSSCIWCRWRLNSGHFHEKKGYANRGNSLVSDTLYASERLN